MADQNPNILIITFTINGLKIIERDCQNGFFFNVTISCLQETHFKYNNIGRLKLKG